MEHDLTIKPEKKKFEPTSTHTSNLEAVVADAWSEITSLGEEFREIYDNASEGLQQSAVNQTRSETADAVENLSEPSVNSSVLGELDVTYTVDNGKVYRGAQTQSRACRASNAAVMFRAAADALQEWLDNLPEEGAADDSGKGDYWDDDGKHEHWDDADPEAIGKRILQLFDENAIDGIKVLDDRGGSGYIRLDIEGMEKPEEDADIEEAKTEAEQLISDLGDIADEIEGMEFPGMFG